jgi:hypothetical protein
MYNYVNFSALVFHHSEHFDRTGNFYFKLLEENVPEIVQQLEFNRYICTYFNCFYYLTVAHKGFPKAQNVVDAIFEICGQPRDGNELHFIQKEDFLRFIRGKNHNSYCGFSVFWFTILTL